MRLYLDSTQNCIHSDPFLSPGAVHVQSDRDTRVRTPRLPGSIPGHAECDQLNAPPFITRKISREKVWTGLLPQGGNRATTSCVAICDAALLHARLGNAYQKNNTDQRLRDRRLLGLY